MTKAELVSEIALQTGYDRATILNVVEATMFNVKKTIADGECIFLRGFGTFTTKSRARKVARNISAQKSVVVPAHKIPYFKPSVEFSGMLRKK